MGNPENHHPKKILAVLLTLTLMAAVLTTCASRDPLYGQWIEPNSGVTLEIKNNGEILITLKSTQFTLNYSLEVPDVMILAGSKDGSVPEQRLTYLATKDTLTVIVNGVSTVFEREK